MTRTALVLLLLLPLFFLFSCSSSSPEEPSSQKVSTVASVDYLYKKPLKQLDGWQIDSVLQEQKAEELVNRINADTALGLKGVLLSRKGTLILEEYKKGWNPDSLLPLHENELLLIATLAGVYQRQQPGFMNALVRLPTISYTMRSYRKKAPATTTSVYLQQLLRMETDLLCRPQQQVIKEITEQSHTNGFYYCPANYETISDWLEQQVEEPLSLFAEKNLFEPLEIDRYGWDDQAKEMSSRDLLKLGAIHANQGQWNGSPVLPDNWVLQLKSRAYDKNAIGRFAWGWWQQLVPVNGRQYAIFYSKGNNYLLTFVPDLDAAILLVGKFNKPASTYFPLLREQVIPVFEQK